MGCVRALPLAHRRARARPEMQPPYAPVGSGPVAAAGGPKLETPAAFRHTSTSATSGRLRRKREASRAASRAARPRGPAAARFVMPLTPRHTPSILWILERALLLLGPSTTGLITVSPLVSLRCARARRL